MLQIATGKLFTNGIGRENRLRGMLYSNAIFSREESIETAAGCLMPSSSYSIRPTVLVYEFTERMEAEGDLKPGLLISSTVDPYLQDFSVLVSFALNCVCTPDVDLAKRLTSGERGLSTRVAPQKLVQRFFDNEYCCQEDDVALLIGLVNKLIGLPRNIFLGVMRALRTYVNAMHRIGDDLELAYTLLVASVESLAQDFDGHENNWESLDARKRNAVDEALNGADEVIAQRVREAFLSMEHTALARRFREFSISHLASNFFRELSKNDGLRIARSDLADVLNLAYQSRSKYVHQLRQLPDMVTMAHNYSEIAVDGRATHLTLHGLSRLMRSIIIEFVMRQTSVEREPYNYHNERSGVVMMPLAPQYWVGHAEGDLTNAGRNKLEGFLQQLDSCFRRSPKASITDMRQVLNNAVEFLPKISESLGLPYLALHFLFNWHVTETDSAPTTPAIEKLIILKLGKPSAESLIVHTLTNQLVDYPLKVHQQTLDDYLKNRSKKKGIRFPRTFEAAVTLDLAERYRCADNVDKCKEMLALAVENHPGNRSLLEFEKIFKLSIQINWRNILLPIQSNLAVTEGQV